MEKRRTAAGSAAALILTCLFGAVLITSILTGITVYNKVADRVDRSAAQRVGISYLTARVHAYDEVGKVGVGKFGDSDCLFLYQDIDGLVYETILYVCRGQLMEMLCEQGWEQRADTGLAIEDAKDLSAEFLSDNLLWITFTDPSGHTESAAIYLRSAPAKGGISHAA